MKSVVIIGIIVGISAVSVFVTSEIIWYYANEEFEAAKDELKESLSGTLEQSEPVSKPLIQACSGDARCISGTVTKIIDGDTMKVDSQSIRFALTSAPELYEFNGPEARNFINQLCPVGSTVLVDEDDGQTEGSYGRIVGVIYCNGINLNEELLDAGLGYLSSGFCGNSEFAQHAWIQKHGC